MTWVINTGHFPEGVSNTELIIVQFNDGEELCVKAGRVSWALLDNTLDIHCWKRYKDNNVNYRSL